MKNNFFRFFALIFILTISAFLLNCSANVARNTNGQPVSTPAFILSYSINNNQGVINPFTQTITVILPYGTNLTNLIATFTTISANPSAPILVTVGNTVQVSGVTPNNFTNPIIYTVTSADGSITTYTVTVLTRPFWLSQLGADPGVGMTVGNGVSRDSQSNSYIIGYTTVGLAGNIQNGMYDYFIAKYNPSGTLIWVQQVGAAPGVGDTEGYGISTDATGNSYITGLTSVGISGNTQNGAYDYFVAKYDTNGNLLWTKQVGADPGVGNTDGFGISIDSNGNSYATGYTTVGLSGNTQTGLFDYFVVKYDTNGNLIWTRQVGADPGVGETFGFAISTDVNANSYLTGSTSVGISGNTQTGVFDYFFAKYDTNGNLLWTNQVGADPGVGMTYGYGAGSDVNGNSYVAGSTNVGISGNTQNGAASDYFIAKYDTNGNLIWAKQVGANPNGNTTGFALNTDVNGNSYITGCTNVPISGDPQQFGALDYIAAKYDTLGNLVWTNQVGATGGTMTCGFGISADNSGIAYVTGQTDVGLFGQTQNGAIDAFIAKD